MMLFRALPLLALVTPALAAEVEVSPGDDLKSLTQSLGPGSIYVFGDGTYEITGEMVWSGIGTEADPIVFRAKPGAKPIIKAMDNSGRIVRITASEHVTVQGLTFTMDETPYTEQRGVGLIIENSKNVLVEDVTITHTGGTGLYLPGNNSAVTFRRSEISDTRDGSGMYIGCGDASCWTQDSDFSNNLVHDIKGTDPNRSDGLVIAPGGQGNTVRDNVIFGVNRIGLLTYSTEFGAQNELEGNVIWNTGQTGMWVGGSALVRNNLVFDVGGHAFYSENNRDSLQDLVVSFNTFASSGAVTVRLRGWADRPGMVLANNVIANPVGEAFDTTEEGMTGVFASTNAITGRVQGLDAEQGHFVIGGGYTDFEDWQNWNYYPTPGSVLRSAADPAAEAFVPDIDFNGFDRNGNTPTIGAYEYSIGSNPGWPVQEGFKEFEDNTNNSDNTTGGCCGKKGKGTEALLVVPLLGLGALARRRRRRR